MCEQLSVPMGCLRAWERPSLKTTWASPSRRRADRHLEEQEEEVGGKFDLGPHH